MLEVFGYDKSYAKIWLRAKIRMSRKCREIVDQGIGHLEQNLELGAIVRALRNRRGWTLAELSARSGISSASLSKIERNKLSPTYANIVRLASGLQINTSELFGNKPRINDLADRMSVMAVDDGDVVDTPNFRHFYLHMRLGLRNMTPIIVEHRVQTLEDFGPLVSHPGEEFTYVLSGIIEVHTCDHPPVQLTPGESIYFDSNIPHAYLAASRTQCRTLSVCVDQDYIELAASLPTGHVA